MILRAEKLIPDLKGSIEVIHTATPYTLKRYTNNFQGAMYGWASIPSQVADNRFIAKTNINNLFLAGHWNSLPAGQGGIPMAIFSGRNAAKQILRRLK